MAKKKSTKKKTTSTQQSFTNTVNMLAAMTPTYTPEYFTGTYNAQHYDGPAYEANPYVSNYQAQEYQGNYTPQEYSDSYNPAQYNSKYMPQIEEGLNKITNWSYDPLADANYQALAKVYGARGNQAAKNSLADAAALNGGYGTSHAVSAAQQARNQYNQELASMIPQLEETAYNRATGTLSALMDMDNTMYGRFRDTEGDRWNQYLQRYDQFRDYQGDRQFKYGADYAEIK